MTGRPPRHLLLTVENGHLSVETLDGSDLVVGEPMWHAVEAIRNALPNADIPATTVRFIVVDSDQQGAGSRTDGDDAVINLPAILGSMGQRVAMLESLYDPTAETPEALGVFDRPALVDDVDHERHAKPRGPWPEDYRSRDPVRRKKKRS